MPDGKPRIVARRRGTTTPTEEDLVHIRPTGHFAVAGNNADAWRNNGPGRRHAEAVTELGDTALNTCADTVRHIGRGH